MVLASAPRPPTTRSASRRRRASTRSTRKYPTRPIGTSGPDVGLPPGQMGNSEVGHLNFGAGRIALMDITRIDNAVARRLARREPGLRRASSTRRKARAAGSTSSGSSPTAASTARSSTSSRSSTRARGGRAGRRPRLPRRARHAARTAPGYLAQLEANARTARATIGTVCGRYWAMDRDNRWERVEKAYRAIVIGRARRAPPTRARRHRASHRGGQDRRVRRAVRRRRLRGRRCRRRTPRSTSTSAPTARARSPRALTDATFHELRAPANATPPSRAYACMTTYDAKFGLPVAFPKETYPDIFPEVLARARPDAVSLRRDREVRARHLLLQRRARGAVRGRRARR